MQERLEARQLASSFLRATMTKKVSSEQRQTSFVPRIDRPAASLGRHYCPGLRNDTSQTDATATAPLSPATLSYDTS